MQNFFQKLNNVSARLKHALFPASNYSNQDEYSPDTEAATDNPYIAAKREWSFMYGDIIKAKHNWQQIAIVSGIANLALIAGITLVSLQARYIPYAVKVDSIGNTEFAGYLTKQASVSPLIVNAWLRRYITDARSVIADPIAQKHQLDFVYSVSNGETPALLNSFYHAQNPFVIMKTETIDVTVNTVLPKSGTTWQLDWTETHHDTNGNKTGEEHFEGLLTVTQRAPTNQDMNTNPLGLYITQLSWAAEQ